VVKEGKFGAEIVFKEGDTFSLNQTNVKTLMRSYGPNSDDWHGKQILLEEGRVVYQGEDVQTVVVRPLSPALSEGEQVKAQAVVTQQTRGELEDTIPF
jgi:hypothetical protein